MKPKKITLLGSTGSIGVNSLHVIRQRPREFQVSGLSTRENVARLSDQAREFKPRAVAIADAPRAAAFSPARGVKVYTGAAGVTRLAGDGSDIVINALVGAAGIEPTLTAARLGKRIALANKESLVAAGALINAALKKSGGEIVPVDSEHSAIFQCLAGAPLKTVEKLIITASGGPFRKTPSRRLRTVSAKEALRHPTWKMGAKITIDSATLMNKGLEVIEAHFLFGIPYDRIEVVIHPQSIVHSLVQFVDGSILAQLGLPDMKIPIQYALTFPERGSLNGGRLNLSELKRLDFEPPDHSKFPCLGLAYAAGRAGGSMPCVMNAANEVAVRLFLEGRIPFPRIPALIERAMAGHRPLKPSGVAELLSVDRETRSKVSQWA